MSTPMLPPPSPEALRPIVALPLAPLKPEAVAHRCTSTTVPARRRRPTR